MRQIKSNFISLHKSFFNTYRTNKPQTFHLNVKHFSVGTRVSLCSSYRAHLQQSVCSKNRTLKATVHLQRQLYTCNNHISATTAHRQTHTCNNHTLTTAAHLPTTSAHLEQSHFSNNSTLTTTAYL